MSLWQLFLLFPFLKKELKISFLNRQVDQKHDTGNVKPMSPTPATWYRKCKINVANPRQAEIIYRSYLHAHVDNDENETYKYASYEFLYNDPEILLKKVHIFNYQSRPKCYIRRQPYPVYIKDPTNEILPNV